MKFLNRMLLALCLLSACSRPGGQQKDTSDPVSGNWTLIYYYSRQDDLVKTPETMNEIYYYKISKGKMTRSYDDTPVYYTLDESGTRLYAQSGGVNDTLTFDRRGDTLVLEGDPSRFTYTKLVLVRTP